MITLSIIIISYNTKKLLETCLSSILKTKTTFNYEIIVVDNNSTDGSFQMVKQKFPAVILVQNRNNLGFGKANNQAARKANGKYLLFLNSDTEIIGNAIEKMVEFASQNPGSVVGGKLLNIDLSPQTSCGPTFSLPVVFTLLFFKGDKLGITRYSPDKIKSVGWVSGACLLVDKKNFEEAGEFDENIFMYMEEVELLERLSKKGIKTVFYPDARFIHVGGGSSNSRQDPVINIYIGLQHLYKKNHTKNEWYTLKIMLKLKALILIGIGKILQKRELIQTYSKAYATIH